MIDTGFPSWGIDHCNPVADHPNNLGLYGWWPSLPGTTGGPRWYDATGRNHATLNGFARPATATSGWATLQTRPGGYGHLQFDGVDDHASLLPTFSTILAGAGSYTLACWVRAGTTTANYPGVLGWGLVSSTHGFGILQSPGASGILYAALVDSANNVSANLPTLAGLDMLWHELVATVDRVALKLSIYLDGALVAATNLAVGGSITTSQALLAGRRDSFYWGGGLDGAAFALRAWTASEIAGRYADGRAFYRDRLNRIRPPWAALAAAAPPPSSTFKAFRRRPSRVVGVGVY